MKRGGTAAGRIRGATTNRHRAGLSGARRVAVLLGWAFVMLAVAPAPWRAPAVVDARDRSHPASGHGRGPHPGSLTVLPEDGRGVYLQAFDAARHDIRIEICVLEDPQILQRLRAALQRGVRVRVIVDRSKYEALPSEQGNLARYLTGPGGKLHLSNPMFPRSFPKIILIDDDLLVYGSACLDQTTFAQYRDFAHTSADPRLLRDAHRLFETDWAHSAPVGLDPPPFNPTPRLTASDLLVSPVNAADRLVTLYQEARRTLDVYTEILGSRVLESELAAAVERGVRVRLIAPLQVNNAPPDVQEAQLASLAELAGAGVRVHVSGPVQSAALPYMHARAAVVDGEVAYLGSISLSPDSVAFNREMGLIVRDRGTVRQLQEQFDSDYRSRTRPF
jgi:phosphatidylserine/phosphatidylglycerophosphate/cardiolipin synthase-like enzyme